MQLTDPVESISGVGEVLGKTLRHLGLHSIDDVIRYFPRTYNDFSDVSLIASFRPGLVSARVRFTSIKGRYVQRGMHITEAIAQDKSGSVRIIWFNQPYRARQIKHDETYFISGEYKLSRQRFSIINPSVEQASSMNVHTARIVPVYRETKGLTSVQMRRIMSACLPAIRQLPEQLPPAVVQRYSLIPYNEAIEQMHFPSSMRSLERAKERYGFNEVFELAYASLLQKQAAQNDSSVRIAFDEAAAKSFVSKLPFALTDEQRKVCWQILKDMESAHPMNRLLEGDVGAGKTVVAVMAAVMVMQNNYQAALMAPTELLAAQHAETVANLLRPLGLGRTVGLLVGSLPPRKKKQLQDKIASGEVKFIIGTHALISENVAMRKLGLVIVDEQHRFGVQQRKKLQKKAGYMPHVLHMTATPIPRSLALTLYGELDISIINQKPAGRQPVETKLVIPSARTQMYKAVAKQLQTGRQVFVVCPLIDPSDQRPGASVIEMYEKLKQSELSNYRIGLLHGKLPAQQKESVMRDFINHKIDILVATTVVEVGVDIPNATVMIIESAEQFGLAQAHQLRGRVGRSEHQSYCYFVLSEDKTPSRRLRALEASDDGFRLAEFDLEIRGPGSIYGTLQHGALDLRVASLTDTRMIADARGAARDCIESDYNLLQYPYLRKRIKALQSVTNLN